MCNSAFNKFFIYVLCEFYKKDNPVYVRLNSIKNFSIITQVEFYKKDKPL